MKRVLIQIALPVLACLMSTGLAAAADGHVYREAIAYLVDDRPRGPVTPDSVGLISLARHRDKLYGLTHVKVARRFAHRSPLPIDLGFVDASQTLGNPTPIPASMRLSRMNPRYGLAIWNVDASAALVAAVQNGAFKLSPATEPRSGTSVVVLGPGQRQLPQLWGANMHVERVTPFDLIVAMPRDHDSPMMIAGPVLNPVPGEQICGDRLYGLVSRQLGSQKHAINTPGDVGWREEHPGVRLPHVSNPTWSSKGQSRLHVVRIFPTLLERILRGQGVVELPEAGFDCGEDLVVTRTYAQAPESAAGARVHQQVVAVDGAPVSSRQQLAEAYLRAGEMISLDVWDHVEGEGKRLTFRPISRDALERARLGAVGIEAELRNNGVHITSVRPPAYPALQQGDLTSMLMSSVAGIGTVDYAAEVVVQPHTTYLRRIWTRQDLISALERSPHATRALIVQREGRETPVPVLAEDWAAVTQGLLDQ